MTTLQEAISAYRTIAGADGKSPKTIEWVCNSSRYFSDFLGDEISLQDITPQDIRRWIVALRQRRKLAGHPFARSEVGISPTTINNHVRGIKLLISTLVREEITPDHPLTRFRPPKAPKKTIRPLTDSSLKAVFKGLGEGRHPLRDRAMVALLWDCCLRLSEVAGLVADDVNLQEREIRVMGKGMRERVVPHSPWTAKQLLLYQVKERQDANAPSFFVNDEGGPITGRAIQLVLRRVGKRLGIHCDAHLFRHTGAYNLTGWPVAVVRGGTSSEGLPIGVQVVATAALPLTTKMA